MKITPREKRQHAAGVFLSPRRVSPFLAWGDFQSRSRFARPAIPEEKWRTTRSLNHSRYKTISFKNRRFNEKRATKTTTAGTHHYRLKGLSLKT